MRMIAGLEDRSSGTISIGGRIVNELEPKDRDVAMVFQSYGLYPSMNVYENIRFPLKVRKVPKREHDARVRRAADMVELSDLLHRYPRELSGGQRQRVALARAVVREPAVFLMDEPLSNLDAKLRVSTRAQIKHLQHDLAVTTIYVTHDQVEAMTLADRVVVMNRGVIQQVGSPTEIYETPANAFVAGFIGSPAMNLVDAELARRRTGTSRCASAGPASRCRLAVRASRPTLAAYEGKQCRPRGPARGSRRRVARAVRDERRDRRYGGHPGGHGRGGVRPLPRRRRGRRDRGSTRGDGGTRRWGPSTSGCAAVCRS